MYKNTSFAPYDNAIIANINNFIKYQKISFAFYLYFIIFTKQTIIIMNNSKIKNLHCFFHKSIIVSLCRSIT